MNSVPQRGRSPTEVDVHIQNFACWLQEEGKVPSTIQSYIGDVKKFAAHLTDHRGPVELGEVTRVDVTDFLEAVRTNGLQPATVNKIVNSLSCFFTYLVAQNIVAQDTAFVVPRRDRVKVVLGSEKEVTVLSDEQVDTLVRLVERSPEVSQRDRLLVLFLLYTGCRATEVVDTKLSALDLVVGTAVVKGKGDKLREVPLRLDLTTHIRQYLSGERRRSRFADSEYLFVSQRAPKLNRDTVNSVLERIAHLGNFPFHLHPHLFRHTFCSRLVARNVPLTTVQRLAGHASVQTTAEYYVNTSRKDKANAVNLL